MKLLPSDIIDNNSKSGSLLSLMIVNSEFASLFSSFPASSVAST